VEINGVLTIRAPSSLIEVEVGEEASNPMLAKVLSFVNHNFIAFGVKFWKFEA